MIEEIGDLMDAKIVDLEQTDSDRSAVDHIVVEKNGTRYWLSPLAYGESEIQITRKEDAPGLPAEGDT